MTDRSRQALILDRITAAFEDTEGITLAVDPGWANTGILTTLDDDLAEIATLRYNFQSSGVRFTGLGEFTPTVAHTYGKARDAGQIPAVKSSIAETITAVVDFLTTGAA